MKHRCHHQKSLLQSLRFVCLFLAFYCQSFICLTIVPNLVEVAKHLPNIEIFVNFLKFEAEFYCSSEPWKIALWQGIGRGQGQVLSPCEQIKQRGETFKRKTKSAYSCIWGQRICLSVCYNLYPNNLRTGRTDAAGTSLHHPPKYPPHKLHIITQP